MTLPDGFRVRLRESASVLDGGRIVVGGSPTTMLRMAPGAAALVPEPGHELTIRDAESAYIAERLLNTNLADPLPFQPPSVSEITVVVPIRDHPEVLAECLAALSIPGLRIIVVDDASPDPAGIAAISRDYRAEILRHATNRGPGAARNTGLARVKTPLVSFVDADVRIGGLQLLELGAYLSDPRLAFVAPRLLTTPPVGTAGWLERYDLVHGALDRGQQSATVRAGSTVAWIPSACLVGRTAAVTDGFSAELQVGEDVDFMWRLIDQGWRVRYEAGIVCSHASRRQLRAWFGRKTAYGRSAAPLTLRHPERMSVAVLNGPQVAAAMVLVYPGSWTPVVLLAALLHSRCRVGRIVPEGRGGRMVAWRVALRVAENTLEQTTGLLLRHWWPLTLVALPFSRRIRAAVMIATAIDLVRRRRGTATPIPLTRLEHLVAARLDDVAYGAGLWAGAWKARSLRPLLPRIKKA